jgi:predicted metal-binding membrane protein
MWTARDARLSLLTIAALIGLAWLALVAWGASPYGRYLGHHELGSLRLGAQPLLAVVLLLGWLLMTVAMMLPTSLPLLALFARMTARRADSLLLPLLVGGYLAVWAGFGLAAYTSDLGVHALIERGGWLSEHAWLIGAGTLALAGLYQLTPLKYTCLDRCRTPRNFILQHWTGARPRRAAFTLGLRHGLFCVGCCWHLMLLMFVVGIGNIGGMLALGAVMAAEKNAAWGRRLSTPLGVALLGLGVGLGVLSI